MSIMNSDGHQADQYLLNRLPGGVDLSLQKAVIKALKSDNSCLLRAIEFVNAIASKKYETSIKCIF